MSNFIRFSQFPYQTSPVSGDTYAGLNAGINTRFNASSGSGMITWTEVASPMVMAVNNGYIANDGSLLGLTLPATASVGDIVSIVGKGTGGYIINQNAFQQIEFLGTVTTVGTMGSISPAEYYASVSLLCTTANNIWCILYATGNFTIV